MRDSNSPHYKTATDVKNANDFGKEFFIYYSSFKWLMRSTVLIATIKAQIICINTSILTTQISVIAVSDLSSKKSFC
jgi:hypothetical protein